MFCQKTNGLIKGQLSYRNNVFEKTYLKTYSAYRANELYV